MNQYSQYGFKFSKKYPISFYTWQEIGESEKQRDVIHIQDEELVILAEGFGAEYGYEAAEFTAAMAQWYYAVAKKKRTALKLEKIFVQRLFRTLDIALVKEKKRKKIIEEYLSSLVICWLGSHSFHLGHVGNSSVYLLTDKGVERLTPVSIGQERGKSTYLGACAAFSSFNTSRTIHENDTFLLLSDGVGDWVNENDIFEILHGKNFESETLQDLCSRASVYGSTDNKSVIVVFIGNKT